MKKAFDQNVSRARPRLRLGAALTDVADQAAKSLAPPPPATPEKPPAESLGKAVKARAEKARGPRAPAAEAVRSAIADKAQATLDITPAESIVAEATAKVLDVDVETVARLAREEKASAQPPPHEVEVQDPPREVPGMDDRAGASPQFRREKLKERLRAVRENPRPEPLPPTVAEAGVLAVERIAFLQSELSKVKALNLALTQDLESARRQAEKATEEARLRMDESRRLAQEMEGRVRLLQELERELSSLEGERDEALLSLQDARQGLVAGEDERKTLADEVKKRDASLAESLAEEERLCGELEAAREDAQSLRRSVDALTTERDTLARQVAELTAERAELLEARKALESVHRALSHAAVR